jgi:RimJ/RimL family protein N-acetyltransferase
MVLTLDKLNFNDTYLLNNIFEWRNDENTRINSINTNLISIDIFNNIINKYKQCDICPYIIYDDLEPIGIFTFILENETIYIGINISPVHRNKGMGKKALELLLQSNILNNNKIIAKIKKTNISSINLFSKYFNYFCEDNLYIQYIYYNYQSNNQIIK